MNIARRLKALEALQPGGRYLIVSGPDGFDTSAALFAAGITVGPTDLVVGINKPGNVSVKVIRPEELAEAEELA